MVLLRYTEWTHETESSKQKKKKLSIFYTDTSFMRHFSADRFPILTTL